jgi:hypothetical protein
MNRIAEWVLGIAGGIASFMGLFILFAGTDQYVGLGGDLTWRVGDIASGWAYGLLVLGLVLLAGAAALLLSERRHPHTYTQQSERAGLITHVVVFTLANGFLWLQDIAAGGGLEYAYWVTIPWGIGLATHVVAYLSSGRDTTSLRPTG